jgi:hypothetical protein
LDPLPEKTQGICDPQSRIDATCFLATDRSTPDRAGVADSTFISLSSQALAGLRRHHRFQRRLVSAMVGYHDQFAAAENSIASKAISPPHEQRLMNS